MLGPGRSRGPRSRCSQVHGRLPSAVPCGHVVYRPRATRWKSSLSRSAILTILIRLVDRDRYPAAGRSDAASDGESARPRSTKARARLRVEATPGSPPMGGGGSTPSSASRLSIAMIAISHRERLARSRDRRLRVSRTRTSGGIERKALARAEDAMTRVYLRAAMSGRIGG